MPKMDWGPSEVSEETLRTNVSQLADDILTEALGTSGIVDDQLIKTVTANWLIAGDEMVYLTIIAGTDQIVVPGNVALDNYEMPTHAAEPRMFLHLWCLRLLTSMVAEELARRGKYNPRNSFEYEWVTARAS